MNHDAAAAIRILTDIVKEHDTTQRKWRELLAASRALVVARSKGVTEGEEWERFVRAVGPIPGPCGHVHKDDRQRANPCELPEGHDGCHESGGWAWLSVA